MPLTPDVVAVADTVATLVVAAWLELPPAARLTSRPDPIDEDHLPQLIRTLGETALARREREQDYEYAPPKPLILEAIRHGRERRDDGFNEDMLFREYHLVRRGLWEELKRRDPAAAAETIMRIDVEMSMATAASLHGFLAASEDAEALADQLAARWAS